MRTGQSTKPATHLISVACEAALGKRKFMSVLEMITTLKTELASEILFMLQI